MQLYLCGLKCMPSVSVELCVLCIVYACMNCNMISVGTELCVHDPRSHGIV